MSAVLEQRQARPQPIPAQAPPTVLIDPSANPQVNPDNLSVRGSTVIRFMLTESARRNYEFAAVQPIEVPSDPTFPEAPVRRSASLVTLKDAYTQMGSFKYSINLIDLKTGLPCCIDPQITNEE
jgi:hypothetical protein